MNIPPPKANAHLFTIVSQNPVLNVKYPVQTKSTMSTVNDAERGSGEKSSKIQEPPALAEDAVFGEITEEGPNYRDVGTIPTNKSSTPNTYNNN